MSHLSVVGLIRSLYSFLKDIFLGKGVTWTQSWKKGKVRTVVIFITIFCTVTYPLVVYRLVKLGQVHLKFKQEMVTRGYAETEDQQAQLIVERAENVVRLNSMDRAEPIAIPKPEPKPIPASEPVELSASEPDVEMSIRSQLILDEFEKIERRK